MRYLKTEKYRQWPPNFLFRKPRCRPGRFDSDPSLGASAFPMRKATSGASARQERLAGAVKGVCDLHLRDLGVQKKSAINALVALGVLHDRDIFNLNEAKRRKRRATVLGKRKLGF